MQNSDFDQGTRLNTGTASILPTRINVLQLSMYPLYIGCIKYETDECHQKIGQKFQFFTLSPVGLVLGNRNTMSVQMHHPKRLHLIC